MSNDFDLSQTKDLTLDQTKELIGLTCEKGKVIGVSPKPKLGYREGIYLMITPKNDSTKYHRDG